MSHTVFNMLPIPPLDGSRVADGLMPYRWRPAWERFASVGPAVLMLVIMMPFILPFSLFSFPMRVANDMANYVILAALGGVAHEILVSPETRELIEAARE